MFTTTTTSKLLKTTTAQSVAGAGVPNLLPLQSKEKHEKSYGIFNQWRKENVANWKSVPNEKSETLLYCFLSIKVTLFH